MRERLVHATDLGLHDTPRDPLGRVGDAPEAGLVRESLNLLLRGFLAEALFFGVGNRRGAAVEHECGDGGRGARAGAGNGRGGCLRVQLRAVLDVGLEEAVLLGWGGVCGGVASEGFFGVVVVVTPLGLLRMELIMDAYVKENVK